MALKVACSLLLAGGAQAAVSVACKDAVKALFNENTDDDKFNADSPRCTLPDPNVVEDVTWSVDAGGSVFTTRADADEVCASMTETGKMYMCADPCKARLDAAQVACTGWEDDWVTADTTSLPKKQDDSAQTEAWWKNWFSVMTRYNILCTNTCLQYYCANEAKVGFEALTPVCSTTTTTATDTTTSTITETSTSTETLTETASTVATMAPLAPTTERSTMAPVPVTAPVAAPVTAQAPVVVAPMAPQGSMPANLAAAQAVGAAQAAQAVGAAQAAEAVGAAQAAQAVGAASVAAEAALNSGLLNSYSQILSVHPGWVVGAAVGSVSIGAAVFVAVKRRALPASSADEFESLATAE